jgi:hypothetical protein
VQKFATARWLVNGCQQLPVRAIMSDGMARRWAMVVVFLLHQGYSFLSIVADRTDDPPVLGKRQNSPRELARPATWPNLTFCVMPDGGFHDVQWGGNVTDPYRKES